MLAALLASNKVLNPRGILFIDLDLYLRKKGGITNGTYLDPWGVPYQIAFGGWYQHQRPRRYKQRAGPQTRRRLDRPHPTAAPSTKYRAEQAAATSPRGTSCQTCIMIQRTPSSIYVAGIAWWHLHRVRSSHFLPLHRHWARHGWHDSLPSSLSSLHRRLRQSSPPFPLTTCLP